MKRLLAILPLAVPTLAVVVVVLPAVGLIAAVPAVLAPLGALLITLAALDRPHPAPSWWEPHNLGLPTPAQQARDRYVQTGDPEALAEFERLGADT